MSYKCRKLRNSDSFLNLFMLFAAPHQVELKNFTNKITSVTSISCSSLFSVLKQPLTKDTRTLLLLVIFRFIQDQVAGAADSVETPRLPSPQTPPPAPLGGAQDVPRPTERHSLSSMSWAVPWASSRWDVPGTPPEGRIQECPATLRRKLISAACIRDLILSVMTRSSWP
ncbi:hypothetical protein ILYODFUR_036510 [Ilyodon furcidens]|uniref:Uncharacterized protein n=1 Tax=Ilyodon furcidens TaxID=33524 RepID=A0ABV0VMH1_9TELE